ncbi:MAG TPA: sialidase family protein [Gemmatimonadales bacterium]|nr:sialidase family protein [Gemmatimonadales bacterium]
MTLLTLVQQAGAQRPAIVRSEFLFTTAPFASAHASTIVESDSGLVAAWFGGSREGATDVRIWLTRETTGGWTPPVPVATGVTTDGARYPCWNPVLFRPLPGVLRLYYKVGPSPSAWWGMVSTSGDGGRTWGAPSRLPSGLLGPIKNKPVEIGNGTLLSPSSTERPDGQWNVHFELSRDAGRTWTTVAPEVRAGAPRIDAIQPSVLVHRDGRLQAVGRTRSGRVFETWSLDSGRTWSALALTSLPNPNSGLDALTLRDGRHLMVYDHSTRDRSPLVVAVSVDGTHWNTVLVLESGPEEYSYPAVIQTRDGLVHVTYTWRRQRIKHVVIDPLALP